MGKGTFEIIPHFQYQKIENDLDRIDKKIKKLEEKRTLNVDDAKLLKALQTMEKMTSMEDRRNKLTEKRANGTANKVELNELSSLNRSYGQLHSNLEKYLNDIKEIAPMYYKMGREVADFSDKLNKQTIALVENSKAEQQRVKATQDAESERVKAVKDAEREINKLRLETQNNMRQQGNQNNPYKKGSKTGMDMVYFSNQIKEAKKRVEELAEKFPELTEAAKHFFDGLDWTELNNEYRKLRDEGEKIVSDYLKNTKKIEQLKIDPEGNREQISSYETINEQKLQRLKEIYNEQVEIAKIKAETNQLDEIEIQNINESLKKQQQVLGMKEREIIIEQTIKNDAKIHQEQQNQLLDAYKRQFQIEEQLAKLRKDPIHNQKQLSVKLKELEAVKAEIAALEKVNKLEGNNAKKLEELRVKHQNIVNEIESEGKSLNKNNRTMGESLKNFARFTLYYQALTWLRRGISEALDTMKELDKAFTDIQLVTTGTKEQTAELAKEYNQLARELGATTVEVAEGAGEWLRQGKSAEETSQLLRASMTLSKVGAIESSQATELLTSSLNGYQIATEKAMTVVDEISAIDLEAATSSEELAVALSRTANMANNSGVSFEKLLGIIGTVSSVTRRSAETIRRSL